MNLSHAVINGMKVIGIGEKKTLNPFITACDKFIYIEILKPQVVVAAENDPKKVAVNTPLPSREPLSKIDPEIIKSMNTFEIDERTTSKSHVKHIYIRKK